MTSHPGDTVDTDQTPPRRIALLSDVHGNLPAFEAVLEDVREAGRRRDLVPGRPGGLRRPAGRVRGARARDAATCAWPATTTWSCSSEIDIADFSAGAAAAAEWTREQLASETLDFLRRPRARRDEEPRDRPLPRQPARPGLGVRALDRAGRALLRGDGAARRRRSATRTWRCSSTRDGERGGRRARARRHEARPLEGRWLLNPGGVGQPRDGDPRAAWLLLDTERWTAAWRRVEYPIDEAAQRHPGGRAAAVLAERLYAGQ